MIRLEGMNDAINNRQLSPRQQEIVAILTIEH
jgi:hypothetical protein